MKGRHRRKSIGTGMIMAVTGAALIAIAGTALALTPHHAVRAAAKPPASTPAYHPRVPPPVKVPAAVTATTASYTVRHGDTLWTIAQSRCHDARDWKALQSANHLGNVLPAGKVISLAC